MCHSPKTLLQVHVGEELSSDLRPEHVRVSASACSTLRQGLRATEKAEKGAHLTSGSTCLSKFQTQVATRHKHVILSRVLLR